jgi:hypothetical protein
MHSIPYPRNPVYPQVAKLVGLIIYAKAHPHSAAWIPAILKILERKAVTHA